MALPSPVLYSPLKHTPILQQLAQIHADCILTDDTLATFLPNPEDGSMDVHGKMLVYWAQHGDQVAAGMRDIVLQFTDASERELAGYVSLSYAAASETGPFQSSVEKLRSVRSIGGKASRRG